MLFTLHHKFAGSGRPGFALLWVGLKLQGPYSVQSYVQHIDGHTSWLDSKDEGKHAWLLRGLDDEAFQPTCMVTYGCKGDKNIKASVAFLSPSQPYAAMHVC